MEKSKISNLPIERKVIKADPEDWLEDKIWLEQLISQIQRSKFFGKIEIICEGGRIRRVKKEQSLTPPGRK